MHGGEGLSWLLREDAAEHATQFRNLKPPSMPARNREPVLLDGMLNNPPTSMPASSSVDDGDGLSGLLGEDADEFEPASDFRPPAAGAAACDVAS